MGTGKLIAYCLMGALAVAGVFIAILFVSRATSRRGSDGKLGSRLLAHARDRGNYRMCVGIPTDSPESWVEVAAIDESSVTLIDSQVVELSDVTAYLVAYPSGTLVDWDGPPDLTMPSWVNFPEKVPLREHDALAAANLEEGQKLVRVTFGESTSHPGSRGYYSTTLKNISANRVRVLKFGGYIRKGNVFVLHTIADGFFTAEEFKDWYDQRRDWIEPGESLTDPNNYGSPPVLWAYYCEAEDGKRFLTGGIIEK
jgi:hypothetical protein